MRTYEISEGIANGHRVPAGLFENLFLDSVVTNATSTSAFLTNEASTLSVTGTNLVYGTSAGQTTLVSGTLESFTYSFSPGYYVTFKELDLDIANVSAAALAEASGELGAMEALLYALDWKIIDNSTSANVTPSLTSFDDIAIRFAGNDEVFLNYGNDTFVLGTGNDRAYGAAGDDMLYGQSGNDHLFGGSGADSLFGGAGHDNLIGGRGRDLLDGGAGRDRLVGGDGDDVLTGGAGRDRFVFVIPELYRDYDQITDFQAGVDRVVIRTDQAVTMTDTGFGLLVEIGDFDILLKDVAQADLAGNSIAILPL
ncbi:calcium-binding protein [Seohaeicola nanhaiensis]|uniref:Calcium-binding protein n=1 Tax=Seohaeicola nanhaiensis TaxID=1387282 RepID=A0ABV9KBQ4_9RHOB